MKEPETKDVLAALNQAAKEGKGLEYLDTIATIDDKTLKSFFDTYLAEHQDKTLADIIRDSGLDRTYAYQIIGEKRKSIGRDKIIALCFSAKMSLEDTNRALRFSKNQELYAKNNRDAAIIYAINMMKQGNPDFQTVIKLNNFLFNERGLEELEL